MKRLARIALVALPLMTLAASPAYADAKTRDKSTIKFEGYRNHRNLRVLGASAPAR